MFHVQNLDYLPGDRAAASGSTLRHARAFLHTRLGVLRAEWKLGDASCRVELSRGCEGVTVGLAVPGAAVWLGSDQPTSEEPRRAGISIHDGSVFVNLWNNDDHRARDVPVWNAKRRCFSIDLRRAILGECVQTRRVVETRACVIPMPERSYAGRATLKQVSLKFERWPGRQVFTVVEIEMNPGEAIPHPGKGENSWDCGEDACSSWSGPARSIADGIGKLVASVLRDRERRGGLDWKPEARATDEAAPTRPT